MKVEQMEFGDVAWLGNGQEGPIPVGVEVKKLDDVLSCITSGRFAGHQLPGLQASYQVIYLLVEGTWRPSKTGELEEARVLPLRDGQAKTLLLWRQKQLGKKTWLYRQLEQWLTTMETLGGVRVVRCADREITLAALHSLYVWWTAKEISEHKAHEALHERPYSPLLRRPSTVEGRRRYQRIKTARTLPGIGDGLAERAADHFPSVRAMVNAGQYEWAAVEGIGPAKGKTVVEAVS